MAAEDNKSIARRMIDEVLNANNLAVLDEILAADYIDHTVPPGLPPNREGLKLLLQGLIAAFPDLHYDIEAELAEGDRIVQQLRAHGTQAGPLQGIPPTGKAATWSEIHIGRIANGKIAEHWGEVDQLGMLQQLGVIPAPGAAAH
jgi:predicted ester cyclase